MMAGRGMGIATKGGGAVTSGPKNKTISTTESTTGIPMYKKGGAVNKMTKGGTVKKKMGGGMMTKGGPIKKMMGGGMMTKGASVNKMTKGGTVKKKMR